MSTYEEKLMYGDEARPEKTTESADQLKDIYERYEDFWDKRPELKRIEEAAISRGASPWAVLGCTLGRLATMLPVNVVVPNTLGGHHSPLSMYVAVVGHSGEGKGLAEGVASRLIPDLRGAATDIPASGESLATMYATRELEEAEDGKRPTFRLKPLTTRAYCSIDEVKILGGTMSRQGSTLCARLTSAWSGAPMSNKTKQAATSYTVPRYAYRFCLTTGVQPANMGAIADEDATGLPQRFLWVPARNPLASMADYSDMDIEPFDLSGIPTDEDNRIDAIALNRLYHAGDRSLLKEGGRVEYPLKEMCLPNDMATAIQHERVLVNCGKKPAGHATLLRTILACLLAWLDPTRKPPHLEANVKCWNPAVSMDDWFLAGTLVEFSQEIMEWCKGEHDAYVMAKRAEFRTVNRQADMMADAEITKQEEKTRNSVLEKLREERVAMTAGALRSAITKSRKQYVEPALAYLTANGLVQEDGKASNGEPKYRASSPL